MKTLVRFSYIGILTITGLATHADPPSVYASRKAAEAFKPDPKGYTGSATFTDRIRPATQPVGVAKNGLRSEAAMEEAARRKALEANTCKAGVAPGTDGCKPNITFIAPPNENASESESTRKKNREIFTNAINAYNNAHPNNPYVPPSDPNAFGAPISDQYQNMADARNSGGIAGDHCRSTDTDRLKCMACNIYFEARGESQAGQVEVGRTVMTRLFSNAYADRGDTTCKIIYKHAQYSWTEDAISNHLPGPGEQGYEQVQASIQAALEALRLGPSQYTNYYALQGMTTGRPPSWASDSTCPATTHQLGNHTFCNLNGTRNRSQNDVLAAEAAANGVPVNTLAADGGVGTAN